MLLILMGLLVWSMVHVAPEIQDLALQFIVEVFYAAERGRVSAATSNASGELHPIYLVPSNT